jgi:RNA polymerase sigma factor (sigma-70 family)
MRRSKFSVEFFVTLLNRRLLDIDETNMNDALREYVKTRSPDAFRAIVETHVNAIYSQCLRQLRDRALAEDVTQMVFITLAKKAATIPADAVLGGWLFNATRYCCRNTQRAEMRLRNRERKAAAMRSESIPAAQNECGEAEMILDDAISHLSDRDRDAVVLRYFEGKSMKDLAEILRISEDAAKQRVNRAIERMRTYFSNHGIAMPSVAIVGVLDAAVKPAAPSVAKAAVAVATTKAAGGSLAIFSWPKIAAAFATATLVISAAIVGEHVASADSPTPTPAPIKQAAANQEIVDQSTPTAALRKLSIAMRAGNLAMIDECLSDDGGDAEMAAFVRADLHEQAAVYHLDHAWTQKFAQPVSVPDFGFDAFPFLGGGFETLIDRVLGKAGGPTIKVDGDIATVRIDLPRESFTGSGPQRIAEWGRWSGASLVMNKSNGKWKLNTDRSLTIMLNISAPGSTTTRLVTAAKLEEALHDALEKVAGQIDAGQFANATEAGAAAHAAAIAAFADRGVQNLNTLHMPAIGG